MDYLTLTLLLIVFYGLLRYLKKKLNYFEEIGIPYVKGWPFLGNMAASFFHQRHFSEVINDIYNENPDSRYVGVFDFTRPTILLRDLELIKMVTIKNFDHFSDHTSFLDHTLDPLMGGALFNMKGDQWREARNLLSPAFTSSKMKSMFNLMVNCAENYVDYLSKRSKKDNRMINTKNLFTRYTNDVIAICAFGIEVNSLSDPKNEFYIYGREATNLEGMMTVKFFLSRALPQVMKFFKIRIISIHVVNFFKNIVKTTVALRKKTGLTKSDMLQLMIDARKRGCKHLTLDNTQMTAQAFTFFFDGYDTSSTQMCIISHELAINPDIQRKLQNEIDEVWKKTNGKPTYESINEMHYLDAVFNESMRRHTQSAFLDRRCVKEFELPPALPGLKPFIVKPGMYLWISPSSIHSDPKYYKDPKKFDPGRYYNKKISINDVTNLGFGIGPRACIGNRFAILETKILLFFLLNKFNLVRNENTMSPLKYSAKSFSISADGGFWLSVFPKNQ